MISSIQANEPMWGIISKTAHIPIPVTFSSKRTGITFKAFLNSLAAPCNQALLIVYNLESKVTNIAYNNML